jgi:hypothetical protein
MAKSKTRTTSNEGHDASSHSVLFKTPAYHITHISFLQNLPETSRQQILKHLVPVPSAAAVIEVINLSDIIYKNTLFMSYIMGKYFIMAGLRSRITTYNLRLRIYD